ncbi:hypothetical protein D3C72_1675400 [compost metagenome]
MQGDNDLAIWNVFQRFHCVLQQVDQDLLQADAVGADEYILVSRRSYQCNALPARARADQQQCSIQGHVEAGGAYGCTGFA